MLFDAYGLTLSSDEPLPFVQVFTGAPDLFIAHHDRQPERRAGGGPIREFVRTDKGWRLTYVTPDTHWADFHYTAADRKLDVVTSRRADESWPALVAVIPAILLRDQGYALLHGTVLLWHGRAIVLTGPSGAGKSTLAATLLLHGARPFSDDVVRFTTHPEASVLRGYVSVGIDEQTAARLHIPTAWRSRLRAGDDKHQLAFDEATPLSAPLAAIISLTPFNERHAQPQLDQIAPSNAPLSLLANRYGEWIKPFGAAENRDILTLAARTPTFQLSRPRDLAALPATVDLIGRTVGLT